MLLSMLLLVGGQAALTIAYADCQDSKSYLLLSPGKHAVMTQLLGCRAWILPTEPSAGSGTSWQTPTHAC